jgi:hypothetical protein
MIPLSFLLLATSCIRERWDEEACLRTRSVTLAVKVDWSASGINSANLPTTDEVNRVSIRFFPKDGSPPFDCYLDTDVTEGTIDVPPGRYGVIAFNESIYDNAWWDGRLRFSDAESYSDFAAHVMPYDDALRSHQFPYYLPGEGERIVVEPLPLASWSLDELNVTSRMALRGVPTDALTHIRMRPLTHPVDVEADVENLASARSIHGALRGLASTVRLASGQTADRSTHLFSLNGRRYDPGGENGITHASFLSLGRTSPPESYLLAVNALLTDGRLTPDSGSPSFDVTGQVTGSKEDSDIPIRIELALPHLSGGISVDEWEPDREHTLN